MPWQNALAVFIGTLPILGLIAWNLIDVRSQLTEIRKELAEIRKELSKLTERVATLEERDRWTHPVTHP